MKVPFVDLKAQVRAIGDAVRAEINEVLESCAFVLGPKTAAFEEAFAAYCGAEHCVAVSSGTAALHVALLAAGVGPGDEVVTVSHTFIATAEAVSYTGATPVFVDIDPETFNIDPARIEAAITERTRAIIPVHLFGQMAEMDPILAVAGRHGLAVVEDAAQAIGATYRGRKAGSMGTVGCLSFYPTKNLGAMGDAGMILTQDIELAEKLSALRVHGETRKYFHELVGGNFRMDSIQAAVLTVKLRHLDAWTARRRAIAARYDEMLAGVSEVITPTVRDCCVSVYNQYVIRVPRRDELKDFLAGRGVATGIYYPLSLHQQECFRSWGYRPGDFPESERAAAEVLALPVYPELSDEQVAYVAGAIREFFA